MKNLPLLMLLAAGGCTVYYDEPPPRRRVVYQERVYASPPAPAPQDPAPAADPAPVALEMTETEEVNEVVYREYYGATDEEILLLPYYRHYYALTDDDIYFLYFVSCRAGITFDVCFHSYYYDCGRNYDRLVVTYNVPREHFFVAVGVGITAYPPIYQRTYSSYRSGSYTSVTFTNAEYVALVRMRVACDYQGHPPATYFARVQATGSPSRVIVESKDQCGRGGHTVVGTTVKATATRGWTLPPQQRQAYHAQRQQAAVKVEPSFKERHADQVRKVQGRPATGTTPAKPSTPGEHPPAKPAPGPDQPRSENPPVEKPPPSERPHPEPPKKPPPPPEHEKKGDKDKDK